MSDRLLPYSRQQVTEADIEAVAQALRGDFLTTGPTVRRFEEALAAAGGVRAAAAVSSGTAGLHAAYFALGLQAGDEIITTALTFAATANAALYLGATVRFVDIEPETGTLDPARLEEAVTDRTRLVAPVDYAGHPADYDRISPIARSHGLPVVADAAHSLGGRYRGRPVGSLADLSVTSFHPVKPITTAEGGAVLGDREELIARVRRFRDHGVERSVTEAQRLEGPWYHGMEELGFNYRLSDVHSALGLSQLQRLDACVARRREIAGRYTEALADLSALRLPRERDGVESGWHLYVARVADPSRRRLFFERLRRLGLGVQVHYLPVYLHPYYLSLGYRRGACPVAEDFYSRCVSIPLYPGMGDADVEFTIEGIRRAAAEIL